MILFTGSSTVPNLTNSSWFDDGGPEWKWKVDGLESFAESSGTS